MQVQLNNFVKINSCTIRFLFYFYLTIEKSMKEIQSLRQQLTSIVNSLEPNSIPYSAKLFPPSETQVFACIHLLIPKGNTTEADHSVWIDRSSSCA